MDEWRKLDVIRLAANPHGQIEATFTPWNDRRAISRVLIDCRTGNVLESNVPEGSRIFEHLVKEARRHVAP